MATLSNPTIKAPDDLNGINTLYFNKLPIKGDTASATRYCVEQGYTYSSHTKDTSRISNDGGRVYNYWNESSGEWINDYGYEPVVDVIIYS